MPTNIRQCSVKIPADLLIKASDAGLIVPTADGKRYYGLSRVVADSLAQKLKGAA
jgi:hypothetical protein